jgi:hypothetical protein
MKTKSIPLVFLSLSIILFFFACSPSWARKVPSGQIVYITELYDPFQLTFLDMETGITQDVAVSDLFNMPEWSHDGNYLFGLSKYPKINLDGYPAYWDLINGKFGRCKTDHGPVQLIQDAGNPNNPMEVLFSTGGKIILYDLGTCEIIRILVDISNLPKRNDFYGIASFSYSSTHRTLIIGLANKTNFREYEIVSHDLVTHKEVVLAEGIRPAISPDGQYIAYLGMDGALYLMKPDGSEQEILIDELFWESRYDFLSPRPRWSPDSKWLVYHRYVGDYSNANDCTIYKVNIETGIEVKLAEGGMFPSWGNR